MGIIQVAIVQGAIILGGNYPGVIIQGAIYMGGNFPGRSYPGGNSWVVIVRAAIFQGAIFLEPVIMLIKEKTLADYNNMNKNR